MAVTISNIKELRRISGASLWECKKALNRTNNNVQAAFVQMRAAGLVKGA